jgi:hypothetical protein
MTKPNISLKVASLILHNLKIYIPLSLFFKYTWSFLFYFLYLPCTNKLHSNPIGVANDN